MHDLPTLTLHVLDLFAAPSGPLRDVRFPDADGERLAAAVDDAHAAGAALSIAEAAVDAARATLADKRRVVAQQTERTLAYARIYAADRPELSAALDAMNAAQPRGPGRPRKEVAPGLVATPRKTRTPKPEIVEQAPSHAAEE